MTTPRSRALASLLAAILLGPLMTMTGSVPAVSAAAAAESHPNVVLVLTDDMRLDDLRYMPFTRRLFRENGTEFTHALSPHPMCCPARAELFTGQYGHNNGVRHNAGPNGGWDALKGKDNLLFRWFRREGYQTAYLGKLMNGYKGGHIAGLSDNDIAVGGTYRPTGATTYNNGHPKVRSGHQMTYLTQRTKGLIREYGKKPFLIWAGVIAPHRMQIGRKWVPPVPPPGYDEFRKRSHRRPPSMGYPSFNVDAGGPVPRAKEREIRRLHRGRVLSLYAADDSMKQIVRTLKSEGVYRDTILVFVSDNGMGMGSHRHIDKNQPYQDTVRVPLMMMGPGIEKGAKVSSVVTLVDLPGTLARLAHVDPRRVSDGGDLFSQPKDRAVLIQAGGNSGGWNWRGVYTRRHTYVERQSGRVEFYDRATDPDELTPTDPLSWLKPMLQDLRTCKGATCAVTFP